jgi:DNA polymerase III gamma/tau subunit
VNAPLFEVARPRSWSDVVGQADAVATLRRLDARGAIGAHAFWFSGQSGTGKTTLARLTAACIADDLNVHEFDAGALTVGALAEIRHASSMTALGERRGRAFIVNEAHGLSKLAIRNLLTMLEPIAPHVVWCFTTTVEGQASLFEDYDDASPLLSRCLRIDLARRDLSKPFAERARAVAQAHGLDGRPIGDYLRLAKDCRNNLRAMLSQIEAGAMLDEGGAA